MRFIDTLNGIRENVVLLMIGDFPVFIDPDDNITIKGTVCIGTEGLLELQTRKNVNSELVGKQDLKTKKY